MISWSPTARRNGVAGVVRLFSRQEWRDSMHGPALEQVVRSALDDNDRVNRLSAAYTVRLLERDAEATLALLRRRLLAESESVVAGVLTNELAALVAEAPAAVDAVVEELMASSAWQARLASDDQGGFDTLDPLIALVLRLAITQKTPAATALTARWFAHPVHEPPTVRAVWMLSPWLSLPASRSAERRSAFDLLRTTAHALESLRVMGQAADAADTYTIADAVVDQIYFASGAIGTADNNHEPVPAQEGFSGEAFEALEVLVEFKHPSIVHHMVETLGHLSPAAPKRAFLLVERAIRAGDAYTYDRLAADTTIALVERYLAEFRDVVASDPGLLTALHRVLDAFVRVGWAAAVSLSYRLGDAFR
jgi:hypothetical protein